MNWEREKIVKDLFLMKSQSIMSKKAAQKRKVCFASWHCKIFLLSLSNFAVLTKPESENRFIKEK